MPDPGGHRTAGFGQLSDRMAAPHFCADPDPRVLPGPLGELPAEVVQCFIVPALPADVDDGLFSPGVFRTDARRTSTASTSAWCRVAVSSANRRAAPLCWESSTPAILAAGTGDEQLCLTRAADELVSGTAMVEVPTALGGDVVQPALETDILSGVVVYHHELRARRSVASAAARDAGDSSTRRARAC